MATTDRADAARIGANAIVPGHVHGTQDIVADHGLLQGRDDDDHPQYHTDARGDARYPRRDGTGASGNWGINVTGNADTVDGLHANTGQGNQVIGNQLVRTQASGYTMLGYINSSSGNEGNASAPGRVWGTNGSDSYLRSYQTAYLRYGHGHYRHDGGYNVIAFDVGTLTAGTSYGPWVAGHGLGQTPGISLSDVYGDDGVHSIDTGIGVHDGVNCQFNAKNNHNSNEACSIVGMHIK